MSTWGSLMRYYSASLKPTWRSLLRNSFSSFIPTSDYFFRDNTPFISTDVTSWSHILRYSSILSTWRNFMGYFFTNQISIWIISLIHVPFISCWRNMLNFMPITLHFSWNNFLTDLGSSLKMTHILMRILLKRALMSMTLTIILNISLCNFVRSDSAWNLICFLIIVSSTCSMADNLMGSLLKALNVIRMSTFEDILMIWCDLIVMRIDLMGAWFMSTWRNMTISAKFSVIWIEIGVLSSWSAWGVNFKRMQRHIYLYKSSCYLFTWYFVLLSRFTFLVYWYSFHFSFIS